MVLVGGDRLNLWRLSQEVEDFGSNGRGLSLNDYGRGLREYATWEPDDAQSEKSHAKCDRHSDL